MFDLSTCPDVIVHYYEARQGPLRSLSDLSMEDAEYILEQIRQEGVIFASKRNKDYLGIRRSLEERLRQLFIEKGGRPKRLWPHYFILGECEWVRSWYREGRDLQIPLNEIDPKAVSFTYGDSFPAMRYQDGKPYRDKVYTVEELPELIRQYGLPQIWNRDGLLGPERYIEAQLWDDAPVKDYLGISVFSLQSH